MQTTLPATVQIPIPPIPSGIVALQYIPVWYAIFILKRKKSFRLGSN
jgi:hypothetical protein